MDDFLSDTQAMEGMLLDEFQQNKLGDDDDVIYTFYEILKFSFTAPLFGPIHQFARSTQLVTLMLLYNLKGMYGV